jgi:hypothetical protein
MDKYGGASRHGGTLDNKNNAIREAKYNAYKHLHDPC